MLLLITKSLIVRKKETISQGRKCCDQDLKDVRGVMGSSPEELEAVKGGPEGGGFSVYPINAAIP